MNITGVTIVFSEATILLTGGEAACLFTTAGPQTISVTFPYPYFPEHPAIWSTLPLKFVAREGGFIGFILCTADQDYNDPSWPVSGWHKMWTLSRVAEGARGVCASEQ